MAGNLAPIIPALFTGPNGERLTADQIKRRQEIAQSLMAQATDASPNAGGWASILAKGVQGFAAGRQNRMADQANALNAKESSSRVAALLGGLTGSPTAIGQGATVSTPSVSPVQDISPAVASPTVASLGGNDIVSDVMAAAPPSGSVADYIRYANQGATRSLPLSEKLSSALGFLPELGVTAEVFSGGQPAKGSGGARVGSVRHDHGDAADVFFYKDGRQLDWSRPEDQPIFQEIVKRGRSSGLTGFGAGPGYMQQGSMHVGFGSPGVWGAGGSGANAPEWLRTAFQGAAPNGAVARSPQPMPSYQQAMNTINPAVIASLSAPNASAEEKQIASLLLDRQMGQQDQQQKLALAQQQRQQEIARRQQIAQQNGINPAFASDDELWKGAAGQLFAAPSTSTLGNSIIDNRTGKPIYQGAPERQPLMNLGDGTVFDPNAPQDQRFIQAPNSNRNFRQATSDEIKVYGTNGQVGPDGRFYPVTPPQGTALSVDPNTGAVTFNQGPGVKPLTEGQSKDSFFTTRMTAALPTLEANESALLNLGEKAAGAAPLGIGNYVQTEKYQLARDAGRDFVTAYLRKDSGAALTPAEENLYGELLLPQPGDKPATIELKRQRRQVAVRAIESGMPPQAVDGVLKAIRSVPGSDQPTLPNGSSDAAKPAAPDGWKDAGNGIRIRPKGGN